MPDQSVSGADEDLVRGEFVHLAKRGPERRSQRPQDRAYFDRGDSRQLDFRYRR